MDCLIFYIVTFLAHTPTQHTYLCVHKMYWWPFFQSAAYKHNSVGEGVFGRSRRVLTEWNWPHADHTATYSGSYWTSQLTKPTDTGGRHRQRQRQERQRVTDSAAIDRADSVTPRCVNQQTFIFYHRKAGKIVNGQKTKDMRRRGSRSGRKWGPRRESADEHWE